jgi:lipopolysaccharide export system protein LptA
MSARRPAAPFALAAIVALAIAAGAAAGADTFTYSGDSVRATLAKGSERAVLTGHAKVRSDDVLITADEIELLGEDFTVAIASGSVHVADAKRGIDLTASNLWYDRTAKIARIRGNAEMADLENEIVVKGGFLEDRDKEGLTIVQIGVRIFRKDMVCRSEFAKYWRDKKILELTGMPWVSRKDDEYRATKITIDLDTEEIVLEGNVQGTAAVEEEKPAAGEGTPPEGESAAEPPADNAPKSGTPTDGPPKETPSAP